METKNSNFLQFRVVYLLFAGKIFGQHTVRSVICVVQVKHNHIIMDKSRKYTGFCKEENSVGCDFIRGKILNIEYTLSRLPETNIY